MSEIIVFFQTNSSNGCSLESYEVNAVLERLLLMKRSKSSPKPVRTEQKLSASVSVSAKGAKDACQMGKDAFFLRNNF